LKDKKLPENVKVSNGERNGKLDPKGLKKETGSSLKPKETTRITRRGEIGTKCLNGLDRKTEKV